MSPQHNVRLSCFNVTTQFVQIHLKTLIIHLTFTHQRRHFEKKSMSTRLRRVKDRDLRTFGTRSSYSIVFLLLSIHHLHRHYCHSYQVLSISIYQHVVPNKARWSWSSIYPGADRFRRECGRQAQADIQGIQCYIQPEYHREGCSQPESQMGTVSRKPQVDPRADDICSGCSGIN